MKAVFQRELRSLMHSVTGWLVLVSVPFAFAVALAIHLLAGSAADYVRVISYSLAVFWLIVPLYAAQGYSRDRRSGADTLLHSLPIDGCQLAFGRYMAMCVPFLAGLAVSCLYPIALSFFTQISAAQTIAGLLLFALCGLMQIALALCLSRLNSSAALNALVALAIVVVSYYLPTVASAIASVGAGVWSALLLIALAGVWFGWKSTRSLFAALVTGFLCEILGTVLIGGDASAAAAVWNAVSGLFNIQTRFDALSIGLADLGDFVFFPCAAAVLVFLAAQSWKLERFAKRRDA